MKPGSASVPRQPNTTERKQHNNIAWGGFERPLRAMTRPRRTSSAWWGTALLVGFLVVLLLVPTVASVRKAPGDPRVSDGTATLTAFDLSETSPIHISGLRTNTVTATYTADTEDGLLDCRSRLRYTLNGTDPSSAFPTFVNRVCGTGEVPGTTKTHAFPLGESQFAGASPGALVTFMIEVWFPDHQDPDPTGEGSHFFSDRNGGLFYKYRIDRSRGMITDRLPLPAPGASVTDAVTRSDRPSLMVTVEDSSLETPILLDTVQILVDDVDQSGLFDCASPSAFKVVCNFNYTEAGVSFGFAEGRHKLQVKGRDQVGNEFDVAKSTIGFRVDKSLPVVSGITARPLAGLPAIGPDLPITGKNTLINVSAVVDDPNMNTNSLTSVQAQLVAVGLPIQSGLTPLKFHAGSATWTANDLRVPPEWPSGEFNVQVRVVATDLAGNTGEATSVPLVFVDATPPFFREQNPPPLFVGAGTQTVKVNVTDNRSGMAAQPVKIHFSNLTGTFKTIPAGATRVAGLFQANMTLTAGNWTYTLPEGLEGTTTLYFFTATDKSGTAGSSPPRTFSVDLTGPVLAEPDPQPFRSRPPHEFRVQARDAASGVNESAVQLHYSTGGAFQSLALKREGATDLYSAQLGATFTEGQTLRYYFSAQDRLGNIGRLGNETTPFTSKIDLTPPVFSLTAPAQSDGPTFEISWSATDANGVESYTIQVRVVADGVAGDWITVQDHVDVTSYEVCSLGGRTYEFRGFATDRAGNEGTAPAQPQRSTVLNGAGCVETGTVTILVPTAGAIIDAEKAPGGGLTVGYLATVTKGLTPQGALKIEVQFSPDNGKHYFVRGVNLANTGRFNLSLELPSCTFCLLRVGATTLSGTVLEGTSGLFELRGGSATADLDDNGLPDQWELRFAGGLGLIDPDADPDGDGLTNAEEARHGTDPYSDDSDGDGVTDQAEVRAGTDPANPASFPTDVERRVEQWTWFYLVVPLLFVILAIGFFVGLARRW